VDDRADEKRGSKENKEGAMIKGGARCTKPEHRYLRKERKTSLTPEG
jgi:hypothetical protein